MGRGFEGEGEGLYVSTPTPPLPPLTPWIFPPGTPAHTPNYLPGTPAHTPNYLPGTPAHTPNFPPRPPSPHSKIDGFSRPRGHKTGFPRKRGNAIWTANNNAICDVRLPPRRAKVLKDTLLHAQKCIFQLCQYSMLFLLKRHTFYH